MAEARTGQASGTHEVVWVEGVDAVSFVDSQVTQDVAAMPVGGVARSFLLEPRGKLRALLWVLRGEERVGLVTSAGTAAGVKADLERFRFRVAATIRVDPRPVATSWGGAPGGEWFDRSGVVRAGLPSVAPSAIVVGGEVPGGALTDDEVVWHRVAAGEPVFGVDFDERTIPQETGLVPEAVSFTKGCYLGQELVARIDSRGHVNRVLRRLVLDGPVEAGAAVTAGGGEVGTVGSVATLGGRSIALAVLRREVQSGDTVTVASTGGTVEGAVEAIERT